LADDKGRPKKQQHTSKRIFERLRDEHGFTGGITIVKDYVAGWRQRAQEMFVPLVHPPGHAQADFGEAIGVIGGVERKLHFFAFDLPHSDAGFVAAYPAETTEAFCDGHVQALSFFGGVPKSSLYDNSKIAVARILGDGERQRTRVFAELQSHYLFDDRFGRPGKGNDKGKVEGLVGYARRNFLVPIPAFASFEALNAHLLDCCRKRMDDRLRGHSETIGERLARDLAAFQTPLPAPYDACEKVSTSVSSLSLVRYRLNDYSVPTTYGHREDWGQPRAEARPACRQDHCSRPAYRTKLHGVAFCHFIIRGIMTYGTSDILWRHNDGLEFNLADGNGQIVSVANPPRSMRHGAFRESVTSTTTARATSCGVAIMDRPFSGR
jgi:transposase